MRIFSRLLSLALSAGLAACGGGSVGNDTGSPVSAIGGTVLSGVAATGAALVGAVVTARCATGPDVSAGTAADGSFTLSLPADRTLPCMLKATGGAPMVTLYSFAGSGGRVNLTPLTDFVVARALASDPAAAFDGFDANKGATILADLAGAKAYVSAQIGAFIGSTLSIDAITGTFVVGDPNDQVLDVLGAAMRATGSSIADLRAVSVGGVVATVVTVGSIPIDHVRVLAGSTAGTGVYSAVTAQESGDFLTLLNALCSVKTPDGSGGVMHSRCAPGDFISSDLAAHMLTGGLPHAAGANIVSGPTSLSPGTATIIVNQNMPGVNVGDSCAVDIFNGAFPITMSIVVAGNAFFPQTDPFFSRFSHAFGFRGTAVDSIAIDSGGVVYAFSMTNGIGNKVVVRPNLALVGDGSETGSDAKVYAADGVSYYLCK